MDRHPGDFEQGQKIVGGVQLGAGAVGLLTIGVGVCVRNPAGWIALHVVGYSLGGAVIASERTTSHAEQAARDEVFVAVNEVGKPSGALKDLLFMLQKSRK